MMRYSGMEHGTERSVVLECGGRKMNASLSGNGAASIVVLSGSGVPFPHLEYQSLTRALSAHYQTIVLEKFGYGMSEIVEDPRTAEAVIAEYRQALKQLGIQTPVILAAHSMGFIEALFWAQHYPDEVCGLVGLVPATPACYQAFDVEGALEGLRAMSKDSAMREAFETAVLSGLKTAGLLRDAEWSRYAAVLKWLVANPVWVSEAEYLRENVAKVEGQAVQLPTIFFVSNGEGTSLTSDVWRSYAIGYLEKVKVSSYRLYDHAHNLYQFEPEEMAEAVHQFFVGNGIGE